MFIDGYSDNLNTVTYRTKPASYMDEHTDFYVNNLISGANFMKDAIKGGGG